MLPPSPPQSSHGSFEGSFTDTESGFGLTTEKIERLGRVKPECFKSLWSEVGFVLSVCMAQLLTEYFVSGFNVLVPSVLSALSIPAQSSTWPASAFSLVVSCFLLPFGRLADMYGGKIMFVLGACWLVVWSVVAGVAKNEITLDLARAFAGLGPAAFLPSSIMLLGSVYRPGPRKNLVFSMYGACAPIGFFLGIFFAGISAQYLSWRWYFFIGAIFGAISFVLAWLCVPSDKEERAVYNIKMDWPGAILIVSGLILVVFSITSCSSAENGWRTPYIPVTFFSGVGFLLVAVWVEGWKAAQPLLPFEIWKVPKFGAVVAAMFMQYGGLGIFLLYSTFYMDVVMGANPLQIVAWFTPLFVGGIIIATLGGFMLHVVPGTVFMRVAGVAWVIAPLLFAVMQNGATYWSFVFPSMIMATVGIDISFNISNIFITTGLTKKQQGLAGAIINSNMHLSIAFFLGFADIIAWGTHDKGPRFSYQCVFWFEVALATVALIIMFIFVRVERAKSDLTADEKENILNREKERSTGIPARGHQQK
ncbi:major facilitator superfamily domain-containing protein [Tuber borchii]|uniref:Major facilitator superfamily domain-containing protein n=1 Tax=Tuber borchii TaxID=42251 RepID=A0A2T6ZLY6_TUBBO|nr:major facilitator superfamily domain-containing protein [Tuber borchii]